jgi:hypothetical protein
VEPSGKTGSHGGLNYGTRSHLGAIKQQQLEPTSIETTHHHHSQETWDLLPLLKACNSYYKHPGVRQHEPQRNPLDVGPFMPKPVYILVSALHTIKA